MGEIIIPSANLVPVQEIQAVLIHSFFFQHGEIGWPHWAKASYISGVRQS